MVTRDEHVGASAADTRATAMLDWTQRAEATRH